MKIITLLMLAACSTGCAVQTWCEASPEHSRVCVVTTEVVVAACVAGVALSITHSNQVPVIKNQP